MSNVTRVSELSVLISRSLSCHVYYVMYIVYWQAIRFVCLRFVSCVQCCRCLWIVRSNFPFTFPSHILHDVHGILTGCTTTKVTSVCSVCIHMFSSLHSKMILESLLLLLLSYFILIFCFYRECYSKNASSWNKVNIYVFITVKHTYIFTFVKKYHTVGTIPNINIVERENWYSEHSYTWLLTFMAWYRYFNKYWGVQLIL